MGGYFVASGTKLFDQLFWKRKKGLGRSGTGLKSWRAALEKMQGLVDDPEYLDLLMGAGKFTQGGRFGLTEFDPETGMYGGEKDLKQRQGGLNSPVPLIGAGIHGGASAEEATQAQDLFRQLMQNAEKRLRTQHRTSTWEGSPLQTKMGSQGDLLKQLVATKSAELESRYTRGLT